MSLDLNQRMDEAVGWHVRLQSGDATEADWLGFIAWLESDARNERVYRRIEAASASVDDVRDDVLAGLAILETPASNVTPLRRRATPKPRSVGWRGGLAALAATVVIAAGIVWLLPQNAEPTEYKTAVGEQKTVQLADGTTVQLNTDTLLKFASENGERQADLVHGEAVFSVAPDPQHPFVVRAANRKVRDVGTIFDVLNETGMFSVTVQQGMVDVSRQAGNPASPTRLTAGEQLYKQADHPALVRSVNPDRVLAWRTGQLIYDAASLRDVVRDLNRYFDTPIKISDNKVGSLTFSGILKIGEQTAMLKSLEELLPITTRRVDGAVELTAKTEQN